VIATVSSARTLRGDLELPGDKSISHRALLIGSLCETDVLVRQWGRSADTESTLAAVRALGVEVDEQDVDTLVVHGRGVRGLVGDDRKQQEIEVSFERLGAHGARMIPSLARLCWAEAQRAKAAGRGCRRARARPARRLPSPS